MTAKTNAREDLVEKIDEMHYKVSTRELPIKNQANLAIISLLADFFNIPKNQIQLLHGLSSKYKTLYIDQ